MKHERPSSAPLRKTTAPTSTPFTQRAPAPSPAIKGELTWRRAARLPPEVHTTESPAAARTPPPGPRGTGPPVCSECGCLRETRGPRRFWSRGPTRPSRSPGSPWGGRRTGRSAAGPSPRTGWGKDKEEEGVEGVEVRVMRTMSAEEEEHQRYTE